MSEGSGALERQGGAGGRPGAVRRGRVPTMPELVAPLPLAVVAVLALNDHVLKARWPGVVTGKLSDVAGCFVLPLFLSAVLAVVTGWAPRARLTAGAIAAAVFFAAMKLSPLAASWAAGALRAVWAAVGVRSGPIVADPTDLVALPLVAAAWVYGRNRSGTARGAASPRRPR